MKKILKRMNPFKKILYIEHEVLNTNSCEQYLKTARLLSGQQLLYRSCFTFSERFAPPVRYQIFIRKEHSEQAQKALME